MIRPTLAALAAALALPAAAEPRYFIGPPHALAVRDMPGGQVIGELPPGAGPIEALSEDTRHAWARIGFGEVDGWVALDALVEATPEPLPYAAIPAGLLCAGVEPFWRLTLTADGATYEAPDVEPRAAPGLTAVVADGRSWPAMLRFAELTALIRPAACRDGMSDRTDAWTIDLIAGDSLRTGCCRLPLAR